MLLMGWRAQSLASGMTSPKSESLYGDLQLAPAEKEQVQALEKSYHQKVQSWCERHCAARLKIAEMFQSGRVDSTALASFQEEMSAAQRGADEATLQQLLAVSRVLTPEHRAIVLKRFGDSMAASCPLKWIQ